MRAAPLLLLVVVLAGCGQAGQASKMKSESMASAPMTERAAGGMVGTGRFTSGSPETGNTGEATAAAYVPPPEAARMIVRNGEISLRVKDVRIAEAQIREVARSARGVVEASQGSDLEGPSPNLTVTLRVPEPAFDATLANLENLGVRLSKTIASEDVTAQAVDMEARIKSLRVQEDAYRAILGAARKISDVLEVQERLTGVRTEIERIVAARRDLGDQAARSKIEVVLTQVPTVGPPPAPPVEPNWIARTWVDATGELKAIGRAFATIGLWLVVMTPVWIPLALVGLFLYRRAKPANAA